MPGIMSRVTGSEVVGALRSGTPQPPESFPSVTTPPPVYFDIAIYEGISEEEMVCVDTISAGRSYILVLSGNIDSHGHSAQDAVSILSSITLELQSRPDITTDIQILSKDVKYSLTYTQAIAFEELLILTIPPEYPSCTLTFELIYRQGRKRFALRQSAAKLEVKLQGIHKLPDEKIINMFHIDKQLPEKVALLLIEQYTPQPDKFVLSGSNNLLDLTQTPPKPRIEASLAELFKKKDAQGNIVHSEHDIISWLNRFSRHNKLPELSEWLRKLHQEYGEELSVVIMDGTPFEFPWEMFAFAPEHFLGARTKVVRWMPFTFFDTSYALDLQTVSAPQTGGSVIAYLDKGLGADVIKAEQEMLQGIQVKQDCPSLDEFDYWIRQTTTDVGLVYLGCHGHEGDTLSPQQLRDDFTQQRSTKLRALDFELSKPKEEPRPLFFINACESARLTHNEGNEAYGFVDACMTHFASGYIGPVGEVGVKEASLIAKYIIETVKRYEEMPIAEALRLLREDAVKNLLKCENQRRSEREEPSYRFLFAFMYVYYGSPFARLRLQRTTKEQVMEVGA